MDDKEVRDDQEVKKEYPKPPGNIRVFKNGAGQDKTTTKIVYPPGTFGPAPNQITKENAAQRVKIRHQKTKDAISRAIVERMRERGVNVQEPSEAIGHAAGLLFDDVLKGNGTLRDRNKVLWDVGKHADLVQSLDNTQVTQVNTQVNVDLSALLDILSTTGGQTIDIDE